MTAPSSYINSSMYPSGLFASHLLRSEFQPHCVSFTVKFSIFHAVSTKSSVLSLHDVAISAVLRNNIPEINEVYNLFFIFVRFLKLNVKSKTKKINFRLN